MKNLFRGNLVYLTDEEPEVLAKAFAKWNRDTEQHRLACDDPAQLWSVKNIQDHMESHPEDSPNSFRFCIRALADDVLIGSMDIWVDHWIHGEGTIGISIGERDYWGRGYGTDAMKLLVQYGFLELNLRRIMLGVHGYNERAVKSYEKVGFVMEGRMRGEGWRDGVHFDGLWMGILREDWLALQKGEPT
jgi:RimJ/RimL family protein N-acetyltransferase